MAAETMNKITVGYQRPIEKGEDYIESLRGRILNLFVLGERVADPVEHPMIRPSINAMAATYDLAVDDPELASAHSSISGRRVNRFCITTSSALSVMCRNRCNDGSGSSPGRVSNAVSGWTPSTRCGR